MVDATACSPHGLRTVALLVLLLMGSLAGFSVVFETNWVGSHGIKAEAVKIPVQLPSKEKRNAAGLRPPETAPSGAAPIARIFDNNTALLLRAHKLNELMIQRLLLYCESCRRASPPIALWLSLDTTTVADERKHVMNATKDSSCAGAINYHVYNTSDMLRSFPKLAEVKTHGMKKWRHKSLALGYHTEVRLLRVSAVPWFARARVWMGTSLHTRGI